MPTAGRPAFLFFTLVIVVLPHPKSIEALRIAETLYEDVTKSALVVTGRIIDQKTRDGLTYVELEGEHLIGSFEFIHFPWWFLSLTMDQ